MMSERHYDDEALVTMLAAGADASDAHLDSCTECAEKVVSFRGVTDALRDAATWDKRPVDETPNASTIATLRAFATTMASEDTAAERFLTELLAGPRESWMPTLAAHPEHRTPGTVRRLIAAVDRALDTMPADAVELTALAVDVAEHLDPATHRPATVATLRGQAWRERAYALFYTGQFAEAEKAVGNAERCFAGCVVDEYELARVGIVRAVVERGLERFDEGAQAAHISAQNFAKFNDLGRMASARVAEVQQQFSSGRFSTAFSTLIDLEKMLRTTDLAQTHAIVLGNLGYCAWKLGRHAEAIQFHETAAAIVSDLGMTSEAIRIRWNIAEILVTNGRLDEALQRLESLHEQFRQVGMGGAACEVALHIAELLVAHEKYADAEVLCRAAMTYVQAAGVGHTAPALTALAIMQEAVAKRTATPAVIRKVREYIRRLPEEPALLFAPLPPA